MIVKMKKLTIIVQSKDMERTIDELGKTGLLHIEHENAPLSDSVLELEERSRSIDKVIEFLPEEKHSREAGVDLDSLVKECIYLFEEKEMLEESLRKLKKEAGEWRDWGDFDPDIMYYLQEKNINVRLYKIPKKAMKLLPGGTIVEEIFRKGDLIYSVVISKGEIDIPFEAITLPEKSLKDMDLDISAMEDRVQSIDKRFQEASAYKGSLHLYAKKISSLLEYHKINAGKGSFERLSYIKGYLPFDKLDIIDNTASKEKWAVITEDPTENDLVPTLIKNPGWVDIIKPVFDVIKTIPGYKEVDISLWFLVFFSVFFGILIGDAGYGAVFFLINLISHLKFNKKVKDKSIFYLMYVLSACAITWGVLTGTFFGQAYLAGRIKPLMPSLNDNSTIQSMCFFIGALHLSIAHLWKFLRKAPSIKALSEIGWILMLWASYFIAKAFILDQAFPGFGKHLLVTGASLIVFFTNPKKNIFKGVANGVGSFLMNVINSFTDVVSYIRLFAVGAATVAVADAFNQMSLSIGFNNIFAGFLTALVLVFGHALNIILGAMAILVHGVRLNVLEFSSHLDMEWSGTEYRPFKKEA
ncbi:MAG: hypothetical protein ABIG92_03400 [Candidatus Omnitrophota bacterium]